MTDASESNHTLLQLLVAVFFVLAIVALLAWAREPGVDGRAPDPEDATAAVLPSWAG